METAPEQNEQDTSTATPVDGGNVDTTPAGSGNASTTPPAAEPKAEPSPQVDIDKVVRDRLARARKEWEQEAKEREERAAMDEGTRLKADLADRDKALAKVEAELKRERGIRQLTDLTDPEAAYLVAEHNGWIDDDGNVDTKKLVDAKPYFQKQEKTPKAPTTGAAGGAPKPPTTSEDVARMTPAQYAEHRAAILGGIKR